MLYQIGTVTFEGSGGASLDGAHITTKAHLAKKAVIGGLEPEEWTGWASEIALSGKILPYHLGGLGAATELASFIATATVVPVMRGDGLFLGWYAVESVSEKHGQMARTGVGYEVSWDVRLVRLPKPDAGAMDLMISSVSNLIQRMTLAATEAVSGAISNLFG